MGEGQGAPEAVGRRIEFTTSAWRDLARLPPEVRARFAHAIRMLGDDSRRGRPGLDVKRLHGGAWRVRVGRYRGIYEIEERAIVFTKFGHRASVYR